MSTFKVAPNKSDRCPLEGTHGSIQCFFCRRGVNYLNGTTRLPKIRCATHPLNKQSGDIQRTENWEDTDCSSRDVREVHENLSGVSEHTGL